MTAQEFAQFVLEVNATFRGDRIGATSDDDADGAARFAAYQTHLGDLDYATGQAALRLLVQAGQVFTPTPGELVAACRRVSQPAAAGWLEAWPVIRRALMKRNRAEAVEGLPEPARSFVLVYGPDRLAREEVEDPDHGVHVMRRLRVAYDEFAEDYEDGARVALARGGSSSGPRRLDPLKSMGYVVGVPDERA
jgi:hypothetical protein